MSCKIQGVFFPGSVFFTRFVSSLTFLIQTPGGALYCKPTKKERYCLQRYRYIPQKYSSVNLSQCAIPSHTKASSKHFSPHENTLKSHSAVKKRGVVHSYYFRFLVWNESIIHTTKSHHPIEKTQQR